MADLAQFEWCGFGRSTIERTLRFIKSSTGDAWSTQVVAATGTGRAQVRIVEGQHAAE